MPFIVNCLILVDKQYFLCHTKIVNSQKGNVLIIIPSLIAVIAILFAGYFFLQNQQLLKPKTEIVAEDETSNWKVFQDLNNKFSFKYPNNLDYLKLEKTVGFFKQRQDLENCEKSRSIQDNFCARSKFNFIGLNRYSQTEYNKYVAEKGNAINRKTYLDSQGRLWLVDVALGQTYLFSAIYNAGNVFYKVEFQAGFTITSEEEVRALFEQILGTFRFLDK